MVEHELPEDEPRAEVEAFSQFGGKKRKTSKKHAKKAGKKTGKKSGKKVVKKSKKKVVGKKTRKSVGKKKLGKRKTLRGGDGSWFSSHSSNPKGITEPRRIQELEEQQKEEQTKALEQRQLQSNRGRRTRPEGRRKLFEIP